MVGKIFELQPLYVYSKYSLCKPCITPMDSILSEVLAGVLQVCQRQYPPPLSTTHTHTNIHYKCDGSPTAYPVANVHTLAWTHMHHESTPISCLIMFTWNSHGCTLCYISPSTHRRAIMAINMQLHNVVIPLFQSQHVYPWAHSTTLLCDKYKNGGLSAISYSQHQTPVLLAQRRREGLCHQVYQSTKYLTVPRATPRFVRIFPRGLKRRSLHGRSRVLWWISRCPSPPPPATNPAASPIGAQGQRSFRDAQALIVEANFTSTNRIGLWLACSWGRQANRVTMSCWTQLILATPAAEPKSNKSNYGVEERRQIWSHKYGHTNSLHVCTKRGSL